MQLFIVYEVEEHEGITGIHLVTNDREKAMNLYESHINLYTLETWEDGFMINRI